MVGVIALGVLSFALMELVSYLVHRYVYHGFGWRLHESHHLPRKGVFEKNDLFPLFFSVATVGFFGLGAMLESPRIIAVAAGVTAYGAVYMFVHDMYIHRRAKWLRVRIPFLTPLKRAHAIHHRFGGEPYGLLLITTPRLRAMAREIEAEEMADQKTPEERR